MTTRETLEMREKNFLSPFATLSCESKGRLKNITECDMRTCYQRDRDRIIHSKAFRRLMHKTQVFLSPEGDHYRTRLTHTLEVTQIARTMARCLGLNEDLTEAIALGHDLGHTPFGHAGERVLNECYSEGFKHYEQSLRVADKLENLNLTAEVRNGIRCHTKGDADTLEGRLVYYADRIAYINHDIDDAIRAGVLTGEDIPFHLRERFGFTHGDRISSLISAVVDESCDKNSISMSAEDENLLGELHSFMFGAVYTNKTVKGEECNAEQMLSSI